MKFRSLAAALTLSAATWSLAAPALAADPGQHAGGAVDARTCTRTSSGSCIRGGSFCPQASYGRSGYDAAGRRWVCKGDRTHPHWMHP